MPKCVIYKITNPTGRVYIGKTVDFNQRMSKYRRLKNNEQKIIYASILKYGWENHVVEILQEAEPDRLNELEIEYIKKNNSYRYENDLGMNLTRGGDGGLGRVDSEEVRNKRALKLVGSKRNNETKALMSELKKGKIPHASTLPRSEKQLQHCKFGNVGRIKTKEALQNWLDSKLIKFLNEHGGIQQFDLEGNLIKEWFILPKHVAKQVGVDDSYLYNVLKNNKKYCKGFNWQFIK